MKFRLVESITNEALLLHWGDLDKGIKADKRSIMAGRGTGHFGTGFYFVSKDNYLNKDEFKYDYDTNRPVYELDSSSYKLFTPKSNSEAYALHDALKEINRSYDLIDAPLYNEDELKQEMYDAEESAVYGNSTGEEEIDDINDIFSYTDVSEEVAEKLVRDALASFLIKYDRRYTEEDRETLMNKRSGQLEDYARDCISRLISAQDRLQYAIKDLKNILGVSEDKIKEVVRKASKSTSEDSVSTLLMKALGYEGVDVSHLNKDGDGLRGLDNFAYGTVIYDLKPGTYRRIREPRSGDRTDEAYLDKEEKFWDYRTAEVNGKDIFDTSKTGMSYYDTFLTDNEERDEIRDIKGVDGRIVEMSPNEYFEECAKMFGTTAEYEKQTTLEDTDRIEHLKEVISNYNKRFPITMINRYANGQEGRHRMAVAGELFGYDTKFPVLVIEKIKE